MFRIITSLFIGVVIVGEFCPPIKAMDSITDFPFLAIIFPFVPFFVKLSTSPTTGLRPE